MIYNGMQITNKEINDALRILIGCPKIIAAMKSSVDVGQSIPPDLKEMAETVINVSHDAVPMLEQWMREERNGKSAISEVEAARQIGRNAGEMIGVVNRLIAGKSENPIQEALEISRGLHKLEWDAERLAESLFK